MSAPTPHYRPWPALVDAASLCRGKLLIVAPHPDDETIGCGGVLLAHRQQGLEVLVVFVTDGHLGDPNGARGADYVQTRREEARRALKALGDARAVFQDFRDGSLRESVTEATAALRIVFERERPATVLFPSPFEVHPDHRAAALATLAAASALEVAPRLLGYEIGGPMPTNLLVDVTAAMPQKEAALSAYQSQLAHQDLVEKVRAVCKSHTVNVPDPAVVYAEAYLEIAASGASEYLAAIDRVLALGDAMRTG